MSSLFLPRTLSSDCSSTWMGPSPSATSRCTDTSAVVAVVTSGQTTVLPQQHWLLGISICAAWVLHGDPPHAQACAANGFEGNKLLRYIVVQWASIPRFVALVHDHEHSYHAKNMRHALEVVAQRSFALTVSEHRKRTPPTLDNVYEPLGDLIQCGVLGGKAVLTKGIHRLLMWANVSSDSTNLPARLKEVTCYSCCASFVVSADRIQRHSREWWYRLSNYVGASKDDNVVLEMAWHLLFSSRIVFEAPSYWYLEFRHPPLLCPRSLDCGPKCYYADEADQAAVARGLLPSPLPPCNVTEIAALELLLKAQLGLTVSGTHMHNQHARRHQMVHDGRGRKGAFRTKSGPRGRGQRRHNTDR
jgi:hypothetical protein